MGATKEVRAADKSVTLANKAQVLKDCMNLEKNTYGIRNTWGVAMDIDIQQKLNMGLSVLDGKKADLFEEFLQEHFPKFLESKIK